MTLQDLLSDAKQAVGILTSPTKSSAVAGAAAGAFSAEASTLSRDIQAKLSAFGVKAGPLWNSGIGNNLQSIFGGKQTPVAGSGAAAGSGAPIWIWLAGGAVLLYLLVRK